MQDIREFDARFEGVRILAGIEVDILADGSLDLDPALLAQLDWVMASVHQWTNQDRETMTRRVIRAVETGVVDCIGHPTGRRVGKRDPYPIDMDKLFHAAREHEVALECNGGPKRMDLGDVDCRRCRERGVLVAVDTDAHAPRQLGRHEFGLSMARRGWLEPGHVLNTQKWEAIAERRAKRLRDHGERSWRVAPVLAQVPLGVVLDDGEDTSEGDGEGLRAPPPPELEDERGVLDDEVHAWGAEDEDPEPDAASGDNESENESGAEPQDDGALEVDTEADRALREALAARSLSEAQRARLSAWLMGGGPDPVLEAALAELGDNPLQLGFDLLSDTSDANSD